MKDSKINKLKSIITVVIIMLWYTICYGLFWGFFLCPLTFIIFFLVMPDNILGSLAYFYAVGIGSALLMFLIKYLDIVQNNNPCVMSGCKIYCIDRSEYNWLYNLVQDISEFYELKQIPKLYFFESDILNIYSCRFSSKSTSILISKGLLDLLSEEELKSVIAHEISHIANDDIAYLFYLISFYVIPQNFNNELNIKNLEDNKIINCIPRARGLAVVLHAINKIIYSFSIILFKPLLKDKEYQTDLYACLYTKKPEALANALTKIEENISKGKNYIVEDVIAASFIVPLMNDVNKYHPPTKKRIEMLLGNNCC